MKIIAIACFLMVIAQPPVLSAQELPLVFIMAGQSNMAGVGTFKKGDETLRSVPPQISFYESGKKKSEFGFSLGGKEEDYLKMEKLTFGLEVGFAQAISEALPQREIILIKRAKGGTSLAIWTVDKVSEGVKSSPDGEREGPLFNLLLDDIKLAVGGKKVQWGGFIWMQGENDCRTEREASAYCAGQAKLVNALRKEIGAPELPVIFGLVNPPADGAKPHPFVAITRAEQEKYVKQDTLSRLVSTDDLPKAKDNLHYDHDGKLELGRRMAKAWLSLNQ